MTEVAFGGPDEQVRQGEGRRLDGTPNDDGKNGGSPLGLSESEEGYHSHLCGRNNPPKPPRGPKIRCGHNVG